LVGKVLRNERRAYLILRAKEAGAAVFGVD